MRRLVSRPLLAIVALALVACTPVPTPVGAVREPPQTETATVAVAVREPPQTATAPAAVREPPPSPAPSAVPTPWAGPLPAGTVALYAAGTRTEARLYALTAGGASIDLGRALVPPALGSPGGRWVASLDGLGPARAVLLRNLEDGRSWTVPLTWEGAETTGLVGLWAFDREEAHLAFAEVAPLTYPTPGATLIPPTPGASGTGWVLTVVDLRDGSARRFPGGSATQGGLRPARPLGWTARGELLLSTFRPYTENIWADVWAVQLPPHAAPAPVDSFPRRQLQTPAGPRLSPDGTRLLYLDRDKAYTPAGYKPSWDTAVNRLWVLDLATGQATMRVDVRDGGALDRMAAWSPDGREILFARGRYVSPESLGQLQLQVVDLSGAVRDVGPLGHPGALLGLDWCAPASAFLTLYRSPSLQQVYALDLTTGATALVADGSEVAVLGCVR